MALKILPWLTLCSCLCLVSATAQPDNAPAKPRPKRILSEKQPGWTTLLKPDDANNVNDLERSIEKNEADQAKLKAGQMKQEDYDKSVAAMKQQVEEIAAKSPDSAPVQTSAARADIQAGDNAKAIEHATQAMTLAPDDPFPVTTRSLAYFKAKDYPKAAEDAKRALALDPNNSAARALWLLSKDRPAGGTILSAAQERLRHFMETMSLPQSPLVAKPDLRPGDEPELAKYKTEKGRDYVRQIISAERALQRKDYLTAYGAANTALLTYADNPRIFATRAVAAYGLGDYKTAVSDATLVLKVHPNVAAMLTTRAAALNEMGRHAEALEDAKKAVILAPSGRALLERAVAREGLNEAPASVLQDYKSAAELDPQFTADYYSALARLSPQQPGQSQVVAEAKATIGTSPAGSPSALGAMLDRSGLKPKHVYYASGLLLGLIGLGFALARRSGA